MDKCEWRASIAYLTATVTSTVLSPHHLGFDGSHPHEVSRVPQGQVISRGGDPDGEMSHSEVSFGYRDR